MRSISRETLGRRHSWSPDGRLIAVSAGNIARLIDPRTGSEVASVYSPNDAGNVESFTFSPDGGRLGIVCRFAVEVWDLRRVRRRLSEMNLDWDLSVLAPEGPSQTLPDEVEFDLSVPARQLARDAWIAADEGEINRFLDRLEFAGIRTTPCGLRGINVL